MSLEQRLAWRNVWRNRRRTGLCVAATVFAVFLVVLSVAMADGSHEKMIEDGVRMQSGHITVTGVGYLDDRTLERFVVLSPELSSRLEDEPAVLGWTPRLTSFALLSEDTASQGSVILGVDPETEGGVSTLPERVALGRFLAAGGSREIVLGARLADSLGARLGDEILVYGVAYSLETAYELFTLVGTLKLPNPELERSLAVIDLADAQDFYVYGDRLTEIAVRLESADDVGPVRDALAVGLTEAEVHTWDELMPELEQFVVLDDAGMYIMLVILIVVVGFGILNTILMAILERVRELGMMMALGLRPGAVFRVVYWESIFVAGVGLVIGLALAVPTVAYFVANPIPLTGDAMSGMTELVGMEPVITFELEFSNPIVSALTILVVGLIAAFYPALKASRGRPVDALRSL
ncbi:MAG: FtsX-like permease family protein [Myxococcota bacterium]|nr:FtsX-like permease family protein [Myxococcota bacterium]